MVDSKDSNNIIKFPKKFKRSPNETDKKREKMIMQEHSKIYCQAMVDEITENMLIKMHSENIKVTDKKFLADYKLVSEAIKSMLLRTQKLKHPLQPRVDKSVDSRHDNQDNVYAITIDYDKL
tara:strand:- start:422 stop:787 length:366 start_codon:yes stop_codon:yes gene_type:complete